MGSTALSAERDKGNHEEGLQGAAKVPRTQLSPPSEKKDVGAKDCPNDNDQVLQRGRSH